MDCHVALKMEKFKIGDGKNFKNLKRGTDILDNSKLLTNFNY